ncbi:hypothetical protein MP228_008694 [Amoeboaphelidium protococcarum]|nr:hypothetical protein MP228_008694 [Amoeboaphelidium protococcarum]
MLDFKNLVYDFTVFLFTRIIGIFFREINSRGSHLIPKEGPVIFVIAPHANQFVDPWVVLKHSPRRIGFLAAKKTCDRKYIGNLARALNAIPVARPQDYAKKCTGRIYMLPCDNVSGDSQDAEAKLKHVYGLGTKFTQELKPSESIVVDGKAAEIAAVLSDTELELVRPFDSKMVEKLQKCSMVTNNNDDGPKSSSGGLSFKTMPHLDQSQVYSAVHDRLNKGECIGIFPEGGSHDRAEMLPLKAGVSSMALGAMADNAELDVKIVPCGLHYFHPHQFRSRAVIEFGKPLTVPSDLISLYKSGASKGGAEGKNIKKEACQALMQIIYNSLRSVTVNAPSWEALQVIQAARRLYTWSPSATASDQQLQQQASVITSTQSSASSDMEQADYNIYATEKSIELTAHQKLELTRRFAEGYIKMQDHPEVKRVSRQVLLYNQQLKNLGLKDHQVSDIASPLVYAGYQNVPMDYAAFYVHQARLLIIRSAKLAFLSIIAMPGVLFNLPIVFVAECISAIKAEEALAASTVKIAGNDVLATWKLMVALVMVPAIYVLYSIGAALISYYTGGLFPLSSPFWSFVLTMNALPLISYAAIIYGESAVDIMKSIKPLYLSLSSQKGLKQLLELRRMRSELQKDIITLVDELGPTVFGDKFEKSRLYGRVKLRKLMLVENRAVKESLESFEASVDNLSKTPATESDPDDWLQWKEVSDSEADDVFFFKQNIAMTSTEKVPQK